MGNTGSKGDGGNKGNDKNNSKSYREMNPDGQNFSNNGNGTVFTPTGNTGTSSYSSSTINKTTISKGGEGGNGGQWGYSGSNSGQTKINPQVAKQITDKISSSESAIQNEIGRLKGLNPIASEETLRSAAIQFLGIATVEELLELKSYQNNSISYTSPIQNTQTKIINEFVSKYESGMNEANVGILLNNIKNISGGEVTGQSKELVKQVYSKWFQNNFGMDTANIKIFNDRCISIFGKPIEIGAFKSTEELHGSIVSKFTSEYGMDAPNTGILLNKIKSETGAEASKSTKEMIKQKHAQWFVQKYTLDEYNMKILDKSCITLFTSPTNPSTNILKLSNILLDDSHVPYITSMMASNNCPNLIYLDLRDNFLGDYSASLLTTSISKGEMASLKVLHLEGNNITKTGEGYLVKALLNKAVQHMVIFTQKLEQNSKLLPGIGTKEEKIVMYREYLKQGIEKGTNDQAIVVDKTFWGKIKHTGNQLDTAKIGIGGFIKCNWQPDEVIESYAQENFVAKISKTLGKILGKLNVVNGVTSCYLQATDEMYTSVPGQKVLTHKLSELEGNHELQVIGESEFSGD